VPKGGEGKTWTTEVLHCIADLIGASVALGTNDGTNAALVALVGKENVASLSWEADAQRGRTVVNRHLSKDLICIDVGANSDPLDRRFLDFSHGAREAAANAGARYIVVIPSATNKGGGLGSAITTVEAYAAEGFETVLLLNDRDGSGNYGDTTKIPSWVTVGGLQNIQPGIMAYRISKEGMPLSSVINGADQDYVKARGILRNAVLEAAHSDWMSSIFWWSGALSGLPKPDAPPDLMKFVRTIEMASDESLLRNERYTAAYKAFMRADPNGPNFESCARALHEAMRFV
jgi:hypothetical protein